MVSISHIVDLSHKDIQTLTKLLSNTFSNQDPRQWLQDQATQISNLPPQLLRPKTILPRLALHLPFTGTKAILCPTHKPLNPQLIHRLFLQISAESTIRLTRFLASPELQQHPVPPAVASFIQRIQAVNSLWMAPEMYAATFGHQTQPESARFKRVESGCEACILAYVGGDKQLLTDLRAAMLGRRRKHSREIPVLWDMVEGWIGWTQEKYVIRGESARVGKEVRIFRRILQLSRLGKPLPEKYQSDTTLDRSYETFAREDVVEGEAGVEEGGDETEVYKVEGKEGERRVNEEYDLENGIISYYQNVFSKPNSIRPLYSPSIYSSESQSQSQSQYTTTTTNSIPNIPIHPAFRASLSFNPITGKFEPNHNHQPQPQHSRPANPSPTTRAAPPATPPTLPPRNPNPDLNLKPPPYPPGPFYLYPNTSTSTTSFDSTLASSQTNLGRTAEKRADSYRRLVGLPHSNLGPTVENLLIRNDSGSDSRFVNGESRRESSERTSSSRETRWSDFWKD